MFVDRRNLRQSRELGGPCRGRRGGGVWRVLLSALELCAVCGCGCLVDLFELLGLCVSAVSEHPLVVGSCFVLLDVVCLS